MRFLILSTEDAARAREAELSAVTGYPNPATNTDRAVDVLVHSDGRGAVKIPDYVWSWAHGRAVSVEALLTEIETAALYTPDEIIADGWFPSDEDL